MIFLSAQPDSSYFVWQLALQLHNFSKLTIAPENIQVLIGYSENIGLSPSFQSFISLNKQASFFIYPDTRKETFYPSSLRPHIIKKHFRKFPNLENEQIFYHDSDIIFRELPNFDLLAKGNIWYLSNTKSYLDTKYLRSKGRELLENMCVLVGIEKELVIENDVNAGGAQYLLKNSTYSFWEKVEKDSTKLFFILTLYEKLKDKIIDLKPQDETPVQAWCADMWALLWNAWKFGYKTEIHNELDFCWPLDQISRWYETKIYHDAGVLEHQQDQFFCKNLYKAKTPFNENFDHVNPSRCSIKYVENLKSLLNFQNA